LIALGIVNLDTQLKVAAMASVHQALTHGYVDTAPWDDNGTQIGNMQFVEVFAPMPYASPVAIADLSQTTLDTVLAASGALPETPHDPAGGNSPPLEDPAANGHQQFYTFHPPPTRNLLDTPVLTGPIDVTGDGCINVCINRGNADCDYNLTSTVFREFLL